MSKSATFKPSAIIPDDCILLSDALGSVQYYFGGQLGLWKFWGLNFFDPPPLAGIQNFLTPPPSP